MHVNAYDVSLVGKLHQMYLNANGSLKFSAEYFFSRNKFQNKLSNWEQIDWNWQQLEGLADPYNDSLIPQKPLFVWKLWFHYIVCQALELYGSSQPR